MIGRIGIIFQDKILDGAEGIKQEMRIQLRFKSQVFQLRQPEFDPAFFSSAAGEYTMQIPIPTASVLQ